MGHVSLLCVDRVTQPDRNIYTIVIKSAHTRDAVQTLHGSHVSFIFIIQVCEGIRITHVPPTRQTLKSSSWPGLNLEHQEVKMKIWLASAIFSCCFFGNSLKYADFWDFKTWGRNIMQNGTAKHVCSYMKAKKGQVGVTSTVSVSRFWVFCICVKKALFLGVADNWHCKRFIIHSASILKKSNKTFFFSLSVLAKAKINK